LVASQKETNGGWSDVINVFATFRGEVGEREREKHHAPLKKAKASLSQDF
jgi:hypothetical protein